MCWLVRQYLGTPLLHQTIENQDFAMAVIRAEDKELQQMQHQLDGCGQPQCCRLQAANYKLQATDYRLLLATFLD